MVVHGVTINKNTLNLEMKLILLVGLLILTIVLVIGISLDYFITDTPEAQLAG